MDEEAALRFLYDDAVNGHEGCFCLTSSRSMDAAEKLFHSLKNEIEVRPLRVWSDVAVYAFFC